MYVYYYTYICFSLILESQKVKQQLRHLEKKLNDLKVINYASSSVKYEKYLILIPPIQNYLILIPYMICNMIY